MNWNKVSFRRRNLSCLHTHSHPPPPLNEVRKKFWTAKNLHGPAFPLHRTCENYELFQSSSIKWLSFVSLLVYRSNSCVWHPYGKCWQVHLVQYKFSWTSRRQPPKMWRDGGHLREVIVYCRFQLLGFGRWPLTRGAWSHMEVRLYTHLVSIYEVVASVGITLEWSHVETTWHLWETVFESWTSCSWCSAFCRGRNETIGSCLSCVTVTFSAGLGTRNEGRRLFRGSRADNSRRDIQDLALVLFVFVNCAKAADVVKNILNARLNSFDLNT